MGATCSSETSIFFNGLHLFVSLKIEFYVTIAVRTSFYVTIAVRTSFYVTIAVRTSFYVTIAVRTSFYVTIAVRTSFYVTIAVRTSNQTKVPYDKFLWDSYLEESINVVHSLLPVAYETIKPMLLFRNGNAFLKLEQCIINSVTILTAF
jgi:hypothetical protein